MYGVHSPRSRMTTLVGPPLAAGARKLGWRFALTYAAVAAVLFSIYAFPFELVGAREDWLSGYLAAYARLSGGVLGLIEPGVVVTGTVIQGRFPMEIVRNCDAIEVNILFASAVLALPARWWPKLEALAGGLCVLVALNVLRICSLYYMGTLSAQAFEVAHEEVFPLLLVGATAALFLAIVRRLERGPRADVAANA
jgi:exosortase/archaeosortase family protein